MTYFLLLIGPTFGFFIGWLVFAKKSDSSGPGWPDGFPRIGGYPS